MKKVYDGPTILIKPKTVVLPEPKITIHPDWVPEVGETVQLQFNSDFESEEGYIEKTRKKSVNGKVENIVEHEQERGQLTYFLYVKISDRMCKIKLSKDGLSSFDSAQMNHGNLGFLHEFYVLRCPEKFANCEEAEKVANFNYSSGGPIFE
ncbi:hypothetical protein ACFLY5_00365 [Patescibacteria group bacterium]